MIKIGALVTDRAFARTVTLRRPAPGTRGDDGTWAPGAYKDSQVLVTIQPAKPTDLEMLPEGNSLSEMFAVWSRHELRMANEAGQGSDVVVDGRTSYRVVHLVEWGQHGYWKALCEGFPT